MRLIDADVLKKLIHAEYSDDLEILDKIDEQPTIEERQEGRWKGRGFGDYECSLCWEIASAKTKYCPYCGALME